MKTTKELKRIIKAAPRHWVGDGFHVHTMIQPSPDLIPFTSPFLLMDYAPPKEFPPTESKRGVGEHPHRGFETVTFAINGEVEHRDSSGGGGTIGPGDVQWMTAASGLVHEEFHSKDFSKKGGLFEMVQIWVNLPAEKKMMAPRYQGVKNEQFPKVTINETSHLTLVAGDIGEMGPSLVGPCATQSPITMFFIDSESGFETTIPLNEATNTLLLVLRGEVTDGVSETAIKEGQLGIFSQNGNGLNISGTAGTKILVLNGQPLDEPVAAYGPFVMNTKQEVMQAIEDFQNGKMGSLKN